MAAIDPMLVAENVVQTMSIFGTNFDDTWEFHVSQNLREGQDIDVIRNLVSKIMEKKT